MSTDGTPAVEEFEVIVFNRRRLGHEFAAIESFEPRPRWRRSVQRRRVRLAFDHQVSVADHVDQDERANVA